MKPYQANLLNAAVLIILGLWGYLTLESPSVTALIPVGFGVLFLLATGPFKNDNKVVAHIIVLLTIVLIAMLFIKPFLGAMNDGRQLAMFRVGAMILVGIFATVIYIKSFIDARKARSEAEA